MPNLTHFTEAGDDVIPSSEHHHPIIFLPRDGRPLHSLAREAQVQIINFKFDSCYNSICLDK